MLETFFQIECPGWEDEDGYISYKVYRSNKLLQHWNEPVLPPMLLPLGRPEKDYTYTVTVKVFDKHGSFSQDLLTVRVSIIS